MAVSRYPSDISFPTLRVGLVVSLFWVSLLPYHFKQYTKLDYGAGSPLLSKTCYALVGALLVLSFLAASLSERSRALIKNGIQSNRYVLFYSAWILVGQAIGISTGAIGGGSFAMASAYAVTAFVAFYAVPAFLSRAAGRLEVVMKALTYVGTLVSLSGIFANLTGAKSFIGVTLATRTKSVPLFDLPASTGLVHEFNIYGLIAGIGFWGACYFLVQKRKLSHIVSAVICLVAVFFAGSRAIYLAVVVGIAVLFKPFKTKWSTRLLFGMTVLGGTVVGLYVAFGTEWGAQLLGTDAGLTRLSAGRTVLWPAAVFAILDQPLYGYGFAGSASKAAVLNHGASILYNEPVPAHNAFLDISLRGGALLAVFYVAAVWRSVCRLAESTAAAATYEEKMRSRIVNIILITVFLAAMFMPHSLGGIGYVSLVLTTFAGIANLWPELKKQGQDQSLERENR